ncbi:MAG: patatin-like phospholipase family protein [Planctomycetota bacterium]
MSLGLALSGGGVRASVFHLGVLGRLAACRRLGEVSAISSVSGGSLAVALLLTRNRFRWPNDQDYLDRIVPAIHDTLTTTDLQACYVRRSLTRIWLLPWGHFARGRASILGSVLRRHWNIQGKLSDLPEWPRITINATCYQTGKNWRFERDAMGDYVTRYVRFPNFDFSHALAASAAVPGLIGPLTLDTRRYRWSEFHDRDQSFTPEFRRLQLWDGGVYDNLGTESLFKPSRGFAAGVEKLIVSDASKPLERIARSRGWRPGYVQSSLRLVDVATDQVRSIRGRMLIDYFRQHPGCGAYLRMGVKAPAEQRHLRGTTAPVLRGEEVSQAAGHETTLRRLTSRQFSQLFRHGYEVAEVTLSKRCPAVLRLVA